ncbi:conserved hypothetical protein [Flavobacterium sp. 9AF]|uniref:hypothetical protein n=1 Tax=Flavobacterium sp. 9AF TaxID=2653142 RepID=UPI0012F28CDE|nr:hypothetical protein [Flavobacterium sp. 9AF]VXB58271.1 conserved hypothetical protein [Flavobacterium sp. 9AF]
MKKKYEAALHTLDFVHLVTTKKENDYFEKAALSMMEKNALRTIKTYNLNQQYRLEIKLKTLALEQTCIQSTLDHYNNS